MSDPNIDADQLSELAHLILFSNCSGGIIDLEPGKPFIEHISIPVELTHHGVVATYKTPDGRTAKFTLSPWQEAGVAATKAALSNNPTTRDEYLATLNILGGDKKLLREVDFDGSGLNHDYTLPQELHFALQARMRELAKEYGTNKGNYMTSVEVRRNRGGFYVNTESPYNAKLIETPIAPPAPTGRRFF